MIVPVFFKKQVQSATVQYHSHKSFIPTEMHF